MESSFLIDLDNNDLNRCNEDLNVVDNIPDDALAFNKPKSYSASRLNNNFSNNDLSDLNKNDITNQDLFETANFSKNTFGDFLFSPEKSLPPSPDICSNVICSEKAFTLNDIYNLLKSSLVMDVIMWTDPVVSGVTFVSGLTILISMMYCSFISVVSYVALCLLLSVLAARLYCFIIVTFFKRPAVNPLQKMLESDITVPSDMAERLSASLISTSNASLAYLRSVLTLEDLCQTCKFAVCMYALTYVGQCFNSLTLLSLGYIFIFTVPIICKMNKIELCHVVRDLSSRYELIAAKLKFLPCCKTAAADTSEKKDE